MSKAPLLILLPSDGLTLAKRHPAVCYKFIGNTYVFTKPDIILSKIKGNTISVEGIIKT